MRLLKPAPSTDLDRKPDHPTRAFDDDVYWAFGKTRLPGKSLQFVGEGSVRFLQVVIGIETTVGTMAVRQEVAGLYLRIA